MADPPGKDLIEPPDGIRTHGSSRPTLAPNATPAGRASATHYTMQGAAQAAMNQRPADTSAMLDPHHRSTNIPAGFPQSNAARHSFESRLTASVMGEFHQSTPSDHTSSLDFGQRPSSSSQMHGQPPPPSHPPPNFTPSGSSSASFSNLHSSLGKQPVPPPSDQSNDAAVRQWQLSPPDRGLIKI